MAPMSRRAFILALLGAAGCQYPIHRDPPIYSFRDAGAAYRVAKEHLRGYPGGAHWMIKETHLMSPLITVGDWVIMDPTVPLTDVRVGEVIGYLPHPIIPPPHFLHRVIVHGGYSVVVGADEDPAHDFKWTVTEGLYAGKVAAVYTTRPNRYVV